MKIVDSFLDALQKMIDLGNSEISDFEVKKNHILEIKNIFYSHEILNNEIDFEKLISFNDEEIKSIFEMLDHEKADLLFKTYNIYKPLVETFNKIKEKYNGSFEAPQYEEAIKWLSDISLKINNYVKDSSEKDEENINNLKDEVAYYKKYYNSFNGNELIRPIDNFEEFNKLLEKLDINEDGKYQLKKFIGISHIKLLKKDYSKVTTDEFDKYKVILKNKRDKYNDLFNTLKNKNLTFDSFNLSDICNELKKPEDDVRQALTAIFIDNIFKQVNDGDLKTNGAIIELERVLDFSREDEKIEVDKSEEEIVKEDNIPKGEDFINEAKEILANEKDLINSVNEEDFSKYLAQSINSDSKDAIKYQIVSILLELHSELEKYELVKDIDKANDLALSGIVDYIDAYKTLKEKYDAN